MENIIRYLLVVCECECWRFGGQLGQTGAVCLLKGHFIAHDADTPINKVHPNCSIKVFMAQKGYTLSQDPRKTGVEKGSQWRLIRRFSWCDQM